MPCNRKVPIMKMNRNKANGSGNKCDLNKWVRNQMDLGFSHDYELNNEIKNTPPPKLVQLALKHQHWVHIWCATTSYTHNDKNVLYLLKLQSYTHRGVNVTRLNRIFWREALACTVGKCDWSLDMLSIKAFICDSFLEYEPCGKARYRPLMP